NFTQGSLRNTGNTYHLALEGKGFFAVSVTDRDGNADIKYTRNGTFTMTKDGHIVDSDGNHLLGESGEIIVPVDAADVVIDATGGIYADGNYVDILLITDFEDYNYLKRAGDTMFEALEGAVTIPASVTVAQGYTEQSNVNVVSEMVEMIAVTRA